MANRGSFAYKLGDPIYGIELTYPDGNTSFKTFPSQAGLSHGIAAAKQDMHRTYGGVQSYRTFVCTPTWEERS